MERRQQNCGYVEFAGTRIDHGGGHESLRIERTGSNSDRDWVIPISAGFFDLRQPWPSVRLIYPDSPKRSLGWLILCDVFSRRVADECHEQFTADVVERFGHQSFRITDDEVADWHYEHVLRSVGSLRPTHGGGSGGQKKLAENRVYT